MITVQRLELIELASSVELLEEWKLNTVDELIALLSEKTGIDFLQQRDALEAHADSSFTRREMVCSGAGGHLANVLYTIDMTERAIVGERSHVRHEPSPNTAEVYANHGVGAGFRVEE